MIDLFCGRGGWARGFLDVGYRVIGIDSEDQSRYYPGAFVRCDVRKISGLGWRGKVRVIVASPPCTEFSFMTNLAIARGFRGPKDPEKGMELVREAWRIIEEAEPKYWAIENVRGAVPFLGPPAYAVHPWYLWGQIPGLIPGAQRRHFKGDFRKGAIFRSQTPGWVRSPAKRAMVPFAIARALAKACLD